MIAYRILLLAGLFAVPALLLWSAHHLRNRSPVQRGAFWGSIAGYAVGLVATLAAMHAPPVLWTDGRAVLVHASLVGSTLLGGLLGVLRTR